jgi:hypothetical protein
MTFCTPECAKAIDDYLDYRRRCGEKLTPESPLIREQFDRSDPFRSVRARHVAQSTIMNTIKQILLDAGLRPRITSAGGYWRSGRRFPFLKYCPSARDRCYHAMARDSAARPHESLKLG